MRMLLPGFVAFFLAACSPVRSQVQHVVVSHDNASDRLLVFISDHHIGLGRDKAGNWLKEEDFRWAPEFELFLDKIDALGAGKTDLVIVGDLLELWQSGGVSCKEGRSKDYGCTEKEALARTRHILRQHKRVFDDLGAFVSLSGMNRIFIIPGNHDAALLFKKVSDLVIAKISTLEGKVMVEEEGYWLSPDGLVYAEHGQQIPHDVSSWDNWPKPFIIHPDTKKKHLRRPWGEIFVQDFYNTWEHKYPIIDNIAKETEGIRYAVAAEGAATAAATIADFFEFYLFEVSWTQLAQSMGKKDGKAARWDIAHIRDKVGDEFLVESLPDGHPAKEAARKALENETLPVTVIEALKGRKTYLKDAKIREICDRRAAQAAFQVKNRLPPTISACLRKDKALGAVIGNFLNSRNSRFAGHLTRTAARLKEAGKGTGTFDVFVFGHTHRADRGFTPFKKGWRPHVINTGAWQRVVTAEDLEIIRNKKGCGEEEVLTCVKLEDLPPKYSFVVVEPYRDHPVAKLCWWRRKADGTWGVKGLDCPGKG